MRLFSKQLMSSRFLLSIKTLRHLQTKFWPTWLKSWCLPHWCQTSDSKQRFHSSGETTFAYVTTRCVHRHTAQLNLDYSSRSLEVITVTALDHLPVLTSIWRSAGADFGPSMLCISACGHMCGLYMYAHTNERLSGSAAALRCPLLGQVAWAVPVTLH